jgi:putative membrane protein
MDDDPSPIATPSDGPAAAPPRRADALASPWPGRLLVAFLVFWAALAWHVPDRKTWMLENTLTVGFVAALVLTRRRFPLSNVSYVLIFAYLCLHTVGGHYTYSNVPYDRWFAAVFGRTLNSLLGFQRNQYDRLVHFCFGFLLAYPIRELFLRVAAVRGFWGYYLPLDVTMSFSMLYELIEWGAATAFGGDVGQAYLGTQGDVWDSHKDMALATLGAAITMAIVALINWRYDRDFADEFRRSLSVKDARPLGEVRLREMRKT